VSAAGAGRDLTPKWHIVFWRARKTSPIHYISQIKGILLQITYLAQLFRSSSFMVTSCLSRRFCGSLHFTILSLTNAPSKNLWNKTNTLLIA